MGRPAPADQLRATVIALALAALGGCGSDHAAPPTAARTTTTNVELDETFDATPAARLAPSTCPPGAGNCRAATGRVIYVQAVDPDGDGDAHFVLASRQSVTLPGITVVDVEKNLRPDPLPGLGDRVSAAGPVYPGSYGQHQIQATEVHVAP
jgi:hypothetical protein